MTDTTAAYLGLDVGSTDGRAVASARASYPIHRPARDHAEQDARDWWVAADRCVAALAAETDLSRVRGVGITGQVDTHVLVDDTFTALRPALLWQDIRAAGEADALNARLGEQGLLAGWGEARPVTSSSPISRSLWLALHAPAAWAAARWLQLPKDHLAAQLTGVAATDPLSSFSVVDGGADGGGTYAPGVDHAPGLAARLPPLCAPDHAAGTIRSPWHGVPAGTLVTTGTMDAVGNILGSGLHEPGDTTVVLGTSAIVAAVAVAGRGHPGVVTLGPFRGRQIHAGPTQSGGESLRWWAATTGHSLDEVLNAAAGAGSTGEVIFAPHLLGERAPLWDNAVRAWFTGIDAGSGFGRLSLAVLEGVAYSVLKLLDAVRSASGVPTRRVVVSGGGSRSLLWCQVLADITGLPLCRAANPETAVAGAAMLAASAFTGLDPWHAAADLAQQERVIEPDPLAARRHTARFDVYRDTYSALIGVHWRMQDLREQGNREQELQ